MCLPHKERASLFFTYFYKNLGKEYGVPRTSISHTSSGGCYP